MRFLHAASSYPLSAGDGTAPFMEEMLRAIAERGHEVAIVVPRVRDLVEGHRQGIKVLGAPYAPAPLQAWGYGRSLGSAGSLRTTAVFVTPPALASMALALRAVIRRDPPDVVHLHWIIPQGVLAAVLPRSLPVVVSLHGADARFVQGRLKPVAHRVLKRADAVVAASSEILDFALESHPAARSKSYVIPHGANGELFKNIGKSAARKRLGIDPSFPLVLAVGRLVRKKGFSNLIRSIELLDDVRAQLYVIGAGPEQSHLESTIPTDQHGNIKLVGEKRREELATWYAAADVVAVPSVADGLDVDSGPVVLMEAMAAGRPVVSTRIGMAPDVIRDGENGYLLDSADPADLACAIDKALEASHSLGIEARQTFETIGGWDRVAGELEEVYHSAIAHRRNSMSIGPHEFPE